MGGIKRSANFNTVFLYIIRGLLNQDFLRVLFSFVSFDHSDRLLTCLKTPLVSKALNTLNCAPIQRRIFSRNLETSRISADDDRDDDQLVIIQT